jgi:hypothetical protein
MEFSVANDLPFIMLDDPDPFSSLESLKQPWPNLRAMPDYMFKQQDVDMLQRIIGIREAVEAGAKHPNGE